MAARVLLLDGCSDCCEGATGAVLAALSGSGAAVQHVRAPAKEIGLCVGCFNCWMKTPGICCQRDIEEYTRDYVGADVVVLISPITFGCVSYHVKKFLDRIVQTVLPFLTTYHGMGSHPRRYDHKVSMVVVGVLPENCDGMEDEIVATFRAFVHSVGHGLESRSRAVVLPHGAHTLEDASDFSRAIAGLLSLRSEPSGNCRQALRALPVRPLPGTNPASPSKRVMLLCGSLRPVGTSHKIVERVRSVAVSHVDVTVVEASVKEDVSALLEKAREVDTLILCFPLYVFTMPACVIRFLEALLAQGPRPELRVAAICQLGFRDTEYNNTALAATRIWTHRMQASWAGCLSGCFVSLRHPVEQWPASHRQALDDAVNSVLSGGEIGVRTAAVWSDEPTPEWAHNTVANIAFVWWLGLGRALRVAQPYAPGRRSLTLRSVGVFASALRVPLITSAAVLLAGAAFAVWCAV
eukprot:TRINITY_DN18857_c0_g1_i1.p1 TRINITY_DN18857_c0_g1~~TRINITY_DN18857_c0_g1_i1.p1  ORF type:complete len:466 (-),score=82.73 TRINITY_DN18857_c0_g1_i1:54-1451(-)